MNDWGSQQFWDNAAASYINDDIAKAASAVQDAKKADIAAVNASLDAGVAAIFGGGAGVGASDSNTSGSAGSVNTDTTTSTVAGSSPTLPGAPDGPGNNWGVSSSVYGGTVTVAVNTSTGNSNVWLIDRNGAMGPEFVSASTPNNAAPNGTPFVNMGGPGMSPILGFISGVNNASTALENQANLAIVKTTNVIAPIVPAAAGSTLTFNGSMLGHGGTFGTNGQYFFNNDGSVTSDFYGFAGGELGGFDKVKKATGGVSLQGNLAWRIGGTAPAAESWNGWFVNKNLSFKIVSVSVSFSSDWIALNAGFGKSNTDWGYTTSMTYYSNKVLTPSPAPAPAPAPGHKPDHG